MVDKDRVKEIMLKEKERSLRISRVPKNTKENFIKLSEDEFEGDYGMCLKWCLEQAIEYGYMKVALFNGLLNSKEQVPVTQDEEKPEIRMLSGKRIELKGGKKQDGKSR